MKKATTAVKKSKSDSKEAKGEAPPSQLIEARIKELSDWRLSDYLETLKGCPNVRAIEKRMRRSKVERERPT